MAKVENHEPLLPSVVDRLIDHDPDVSTEPRWTQTIGQLKTCVMRDLESLLNARRQTDELPGNLVELRDSSFFYGLPDFSSTSGDVPEHRETLRSAVQKAIAQHEPRLKDVQVRLVTSPGDTHRTVHFVVDGMLMVEPHPEPVSFDTMVRPFGAGCEVKDNG